MSDWSFCLIAIIDTLLFVNYDKLIFSCKVQSTSPFLDIVQVLSLILKYTIYHVRITVK